jgi:hypothetical protein
MKTSVWLSEELAQRWHDSGMSLSELVKRGLDASEGKDPDDRLRRIIREELDVALKPSDL